MIPKAESDRLKEELEDLLQEDAHNSERLLRRLDALSRESGVEAHAALLCVLTGISFGEGEARDHWEAILRHRHQMALALGRDVGVRVATFDYFVNCNRRLTHPAIIDLAMAESGKDAGATDPATGLASDRTFRTALQSELRRCRRYGQQAAIALFDLDDFGEIAARVGPAVAPRLLREAAMLLSNKVRDIDVASRPGEDEFALLLPETDRNGAILVAERFREELQAYFRRREAGGEPVALTVSCGVACHPSDGRSAEDLLSHAAQALYAAKASGKNAVQVFQPERRRFLRFDLEPERCEVEVLAPRDLAARPARNLSRSGMLFSSPEPLEVGEEIELRVVGGGASTLRLRGRVVRLEELPPDAPTGDRFEIGIAFDPEPGEGDADLVQFLERYLQRASGRVP